MTKAQTKAMFEAATHACYFGPAKEERIIWCLKQAGASLRDARDFIDCAIEAKLMHRNVSGGHWISVTPFLCGIGANFDDLAAEAGAWEDES